MKYRRLNPDELHELEQPFIRYLAANSITAGDWEKIKTDTPEQAERYIDFFSDLVFDKVLKGLEYLEYKTPHDIKTFHCLPDRIVMLGLKVDGRTPLDFTRNQSPQEMLQMVQGSGAALQLYRGEKAYQQEREQELFEMMENGARISRDGALYKTLEQLKK